MLLKALISRTTTIESRSNLYMYVIAHNTAIALAWFYIKYMCHACNMTLQLSRNFTEHQSIHIWTYQIILHTLMSNPLSGYPWSLSPVQLSCPWPDSSLSPSSLTFIIALQTPIVQNCQPPQGESVHQDCKIAAQIPLHLTWWTQKHSHPPDSKLMLKLICDTAGHDFLSR